MARFPLARYSANFERDVARFIRPGGDPSSPVLPLERIYTTDGVPVGFSFFSVSDGYTATLSTADSLGGAKSALITATTQAAGYGELIVTATDLEVGKMYRFSGAYKLLAAEAAWRYCALSSRIEDDAGNLLSSDGRSYGAASGFTLTARPGEWLRFIVDFIPRTARTLLKVRLDTTSPVSALAYFDVIKLSRIWRFEQYERRLSVGSVPELAASSTGVFFGPRTVSNADITLANGDAILDRAIGTLTFINQEAEIRVAGESEDGKSVTIEDSFQQFKGFIQDISWNPNEVGFTIESTRFDFHRLLPLNTYGDTGAEVQAVGRPRPLFFGQKNGIKPYRTSKETTYNKYGVYEIADCSDAPNGIKALDQVYSYEDMEALTNKDSSRRMLLSAGTDYSADLATGILTVIRDVKPYRIAESNRYLNFHIGGGNLVATLTKGLYGAAALATHIAAQMTSAAGTAITCTYSETTNLFTVGKAAGTLALLVSTGANKEASAWATIGFSRSADKTGSLSYAGSDATFTDVDRDHLIAVNAQGYKDDAAGTYTGTASAVIQKAPDIAKCIAVRWLKIPIENIDTATFEASRSSAPYALAAYIKESTSSQLIMQTIERSVMGQIAVDGSGKLRFIVYTGAVPANAKTIEQHHILDGMTVTSSSEEIYQTVQVQYNQDPVTDLWFGRSATDVSGSTEFRRGEILTIDTYLRISDNAEVMAYNYLTLAQRPSQKISLPVGAILMGSEVGDLVRLKADRGPIAQGKYTGAAFRILGYRKSAVEGVVVADLVQDATTSAGATCISSCQEVCEGSAQDCTASCQNSCQLSTCQAVCETNGQGCGITVCQVSCEAACQGCGQTVCQTTCETSCQTTCELGAQTCSVGCEVACQGCGQTACQAACETACQSTCQLNGCQEACQVAVQGCDACQTAAQGCEASCQDPCEANCQDACQFACQGPCQSLCESQSEIPQA